MSNNNIHIPAAPATRNIWQGEERRGTPLNPSDHTLYLHLKDEIKSHQEIIFNELREHTVDEMGRFKDILDEIRATSDHTRIQHSKLSEMISETIKEINKLSDVQKTIVSAFPRGIEGLQTHSLYHQEEEDAKKGKIEIINEIKKKVMAGAVWAAISLFGYVIIDWFKTQLHK
jgi:hypothetical protein